ncbi:hypothetical protein FF1_034335 [Malus domestica]
MAIMMTGNKFDLNHLRTSSEDDGQPLIEREGLSFLETSALEATNINELKLKLQTFHSSRALTASLLLRFTSVFLLRHGYCLKLSSELSDNTKKPHHSAELQAEEESEVDHLELHYAVQPQKTKTTVFGTNPQTSDDQVPGHHRSGYIFFITESPTVRGPVGDMKDGRHMLSGEGGTASSPRFKSKRRSKGPDIFKGVEERRGRTNQDLRSARREFLHAKIQVCFETNCVPL